MDNQAPPQSRPQAVQIGEWTGAVARLVEQAQSEPLIKAPVRARNALDALSRHHPMNGEVALLDVVSNRGSFAKAFLDAAPNARLTAVEPDERFAQSCDGLPRTELIQAQQAIEV